MIRPKSFYKAAENTYGLWYDFSYWLIMLFAYFI